MFRKLTDRIHRATSSGAADPNVQTLMALGFDATTASNALQAANGNVDRAAELLLSQQQQQPQRQAGGGAAAATPSAQQQQQRSEEETLQRVMEESLETAQREQTSRKTRPVRSAASTKAGQAAAARAEGRATPPRSHSGGLSAHHPDVKLIPKLHDKPKEEQILRTADRMKNSPAAVDTLLRALTAVQNNPNEAKFRKIDKTTAGYQRSVAPAPGAEDLLRAMNFRTGQNSNTLVLDQPMVDPALLYLGISALEQTQQTPEYQQAKQKLQFAKRVREIQAAADSSVDEAVKRANYMSACPSEPAEGRGALMQVLLGDETIRRRFDGDDTLRDVLNWLGGHGSVIPDLILSREWSLVDRNRYPTVPIHCEKQQHDTLQYIGCWPSGRLEILPSTPEWMAGNGGGVKPGSSRGLGSAPSDVMH